MPSDSKKDFNAEALLSDHGKDISGLRDKFDKCYSSERYEDFQAAVEKIASRFFKSYIAWGALIWLVSIIASMLAQKFFKLF